MKVGLLYEIEWAKPWSDGWEYERYHEALDQIALADELGFHAAWAVEHHFLPEFSHSSAPDDPDNLFRMNQNIEPAG